MGKCINCGKDTDNLKLLCDECYNIKEAEPKKEDSFIKADSGKLEWHLMPFNELEDVVRVLMNGAKTYSPDNWKKCDDTKRYEDALMRHIVEYQKGNKLDNGPKGDGLPHLAHAICNCLFLMWFDNKSQEYEDKALYEEYVRKSLRDQK